MVVEVTSNRYKKKKNIEKSKLKNFESEKSYKKKIIVEEKTKKRC